VDPTYKANRPTSEATLQHQIKLAIETLTADGFPVWSVKGFEADDLIATATAKALEIPGASVLIASSDKDLAALVGPLVRTKSTSTGEIYDGAGVLAKFGVEPGQMRDYLTLVGDTADNIKGAKGIGSKKAAALLGELVTLDEVYRAIDRGDKFQPSTLTALAELRPRLETVRKLVTMRTDAPIPFDEIKADRVPVDASFAEEEMSEQSIEAEAVAFVAETTTSSTGAVPLVEVPKPVPVTGIVVREPDALAPAPAEWERQLDPRSQREAMALADNMFKARMFSAYGTPHGILSTVLVGRELGLPAMAALRSIHVVEGRHTLAASLMVALILKSGLAEYFEPVSFDATQATYETKRKGARNGVTLQHTMDMAVAAGLVKDKSGWVKNPIDMLCARASSRLARMVYPDLLAGLYTPEELEDARG
jgi:hypothetical protein